MTLAHDRSGSGTPLVLVHGIGSHRKVWRLVTDHLAAQHDVIAVDLPGFGDTPPLPGTHVTPADLADAVERFLDGQALDSVHLCGNSLGGWISFELAARGRARTVTALGPAGLFHPRPPGRRPLSTATYTAVTLRVSKTLARRTRTIQPTLLRSRLVRKAALSQQCLRGGDLPVEIVAEAVAAYGDCTGFSAVMHGCALGPFVRGEEISVPVTVAFGEHDRVIPRRTRLRDMLPAHTRWVDLPGCGHVPHWDDPAIVVETVLKTTADA